MKGQFAQPRAGGRPEPRPAPVTLVTRQKTGETCLLRRGSCQTRLRCCRSAPPRANTDQYVVGNTWATRGQPASNTWSSSPGCRYLPPGSRFLPRASEFPPPGSIFPLHSVRSPSFQTQLALGPRLGSISPCPVDSQILQGFQRSICVRMTPIILSNSIRNGWRHRQRWICPAFVGTAGVLGRCRTWHIPSIETTSGRCCPKNRGVMQNTVVFSWSNAKVDRYAKTSSSPIRPSSGGNHRRAHPHRAPHDRSRNGRP